MALAASKLLMLGSIAKYSRLGAIQAIVIFLVASSSSAYAVTALDAQTLLLSSGHKLRLYNVITPNAAQCSCPGECLLAERARKYMQKLLSQADSDVRIQAIGVDPDGTIRGKVFVNSQDLSILMIENGFARLPNARTNTSWCLG